MTVLVSGWVALDDIETPFGKVEGSLGGSATFSALAASLFTEVRLLAVIGEDFPAELVVKLDRANIDLSRLETVHGGKTSRWGARYAFDMNSRETWYPELGVSVVHLPPLPPEWSDCTGVCLAAGEPKYQRTLLEGVSEPKVSVMDTIKMFIEEARDELWLTMGKADFVTVNDSEARMLAETPSVAKAARKLLTAGPRRGVIIKLGEYGAAFASGEDYFVAPGYPLDEVVDPTGAGDAFAGGFTGYLDTVREVTSAEIRRAVIYASAVASFSVEGFGPARLLTLTREELDGRYAEFKRLTHFDVEG